MSVGSDVPHSPFAIASRFQQVWRTFRHDALARLGIDSYVVSAQGARFRVSTSDFIDRFIAVFGIWEQPQLEDLARFAATRRIDAFLDVGANAGFYSIMFAVKRLAPRIIAFEPDPGNYRRLITNLRLNGLLGRIETEPLALGDREGEVTLYEGGAWNRGESTIAVPEQTPRLVAHMVRQVRLDDRYAFRGLIMIVKIDVEGYEFEALAGMERTLRENVCYLQVELYSERLEELKALLAGYGYRFLHTQDIDHVFTNLPET